MTTQRAQHGWAKLTFKGNDVSGAQVSGSIPDAESLIFSFTNGLVRTVSARSGNINEMIVATGRLANIQVLEMDTRPDTLERAFPDMTRAGDVLTYDSTDINKELSTTTLSGTLTIHPYDQASTDLDWVCYGCLIPTDGNWSITPGGAIRVPLQFESLYRDNADGDIHSLGAGADTTAPTISTWTPGDGGTMAVDANVVIEFSEAMDSSTITTDNIILLDDSEVVVATTITYASGTYEATVNPDSNLSASTDHRVIVTTDVKDAAGNNKAAHESIKFTTT